MSKRMKFSGSGLVLVFATFVMQYFQADAYAADWAGINIVDSISGRGIPLVELETTNAVVFVTDNNGMVAIDDPELLEREIFFFVSGHGYEIKKDNFGIAGFRCTLKKGSILEVRLERKILAERMTRLTGTGLWRDSKLLHVPINKAREPINGNVVGQDSIQSVLYNGKVICLWGDTSRGDYPLGLFRTSGARYSLALDREERFEPSHGIPYEYFVDAATGFPRAMMPLEERPEGVIWMSGLAVVKDEDASKDVLIAHYSRRQGLFKELEQGIALYNDRKNIFEPLFQIQDEKEWRHPGGHSLRVQDGSKDWIMFCNPFPNVRVPASRQSICDLSQYEAFAPTSLDKNANAEKLEWSWRRDGIPMDAQKEVGMIQGAEGKDYHPYFSPVDINDTNTRVLLHSGAVRWNAFRQKWILIAGRIYGKDSILGEVWYSEAVHPTGPFTKAIKIATHDKQSFYNVCQHDFLDQEGGKIIFFEGTYTNEFSGNQHKTPRYHYNQILYRLNLEDPAFLSSLNR